MVANGAAKELPIEASDRRLQFAIEALQAAYQQKRGLGKSHGEFSVTLHFKAGVVEMVTVNDAVTYK